VPVFPVLIAWRDLRFDVELVENEDRYLAHLRTGWVHELGYPLRSLTIESLSATVPLRAEFVRAVPVALMLNLGVSQYGLDDDEEMLAAIEELEQGGGRLLRARGIQDEEALRLVALIYALALARGRAPAEEVARFLKCSPATASKWVAAARDAQQLHITTGRRR
jgi:hypothetical protein